MEPRLNRVLRGLARYTTASDSTVRASSRPPLHAALGTQDIQLLWVPLPRATSTHFSLARSLWPGCHLRAPDPSSSQRSAESAYVRATLTHDFATKGTRHSLKLHSIRAAGTWEDACSAIQSCRFYGIRSISRLPTLCSRFSKQGSVFLYP